MPVLNTINGTMGKKREKKGRNGKKRQEEREIMSENVLNRKGGGTFMRRQLNTF